MTCKLVYKTENGYIELFKTILSSLDYSCHYDEKNEEKLRDIFSIEIEDLEGEFKILIDPRTIPAKEMEYHKDMFDFNHMKELDVRYDLPDLETIIKRISNMMIENDKVLDSIYSRFEDNLNNDDKVNYMIYCFANNRDKQIEILDSFLNERYEEEEGYLFARELESYCSKVYTEDKEKKDNKVFIRG